MTNPSSDHRALLEFSPLLHGAIRFSEIDSSHFGAAIQTGLEIARARVRGIESSVEKASFENTIEALETASEELDAASSVFMNFLSAETKPELQALAQTVLPQLAAFSNDIFLSEPLFHRLKTVRDAQLSSGDKLLTGERKRLLEKTWKAFVRNGAGLSVEQKDRIRQIDSRMAVLTQKFSDHVLKDTNSYAMVLSTEEELRGLPEGAREAAAQLARERGHEGKYIFTLQQPSLVAFLTYSEQRDLREKLWRASGARGTQGDTDNRPLAIEIASLRHERAKILGYSSHAAFVLEERMASSLERVNGFLLGVLEKVRPAAERDLAALEKTAGHPLKPWDTAFYAEKLKQRLFDLKDEEVRQYFPLQKVLDGVFEHARRLYRLDFVKRTDIPGYHPEVEVFEVKDTQTHESIGLLYTDFHPRESKRGGAWMTTYREQGLFQGEVRRPLVSIVCNLTKPTPSKPSLLSLDEVRTVFHEFGHALHGLLSRCHYRSLGGTNVFWDFVELPSQIMENWVREREGLALFARHYETGEVIPDALIQKIQESSRYLAGWMGLRQVNFGVLDMAWHGADPSGIRDLEAFEVQATAKTTLFTAEPGVMVSTGFSHIFSGGYSAGYYSYKWAEVLDADAFEYFREKGIFNPEVAQRFRSCVLERGGSEHPMELYRQFRGREPDPNALFRRDGLI